MKTLVLFVFLMLLLLGTNVYAGSIPAPCETETNCDCAQQFCTYKQLFNYHESRLKEIAWHNIKNLVSSTDNDIYLYGSFPPGFENRAIPGPEPIIGGWTEIFEEYAGVGPVSGAQKYLENETFFWKYSKVNLVWGWSTSLPSLRNIRYTLTAKEDFADQIKSDPALLEKFRNVCYTKWLSGPLKVEPWPCIELFEIGQPTIQRVIKLQVTPANAVGSAYARGYVGGAVAGQPLYGQWQAPYYVISGVQPGAQYMLDIVAKPGSGYLPWGETVIVPADKDLVKSINLQQAPNMAQSVGKGNLTIKLISEKGSAIAGTAIYNIHTNPLKPEPVNVPATGVTIPNLATGNYRVIITPQGGNYFPNPKEISLFPVNAITPNVLTVTFQEVETPVQPPVQPPTGSETSILVINLTALVQQGIISNVSAAKVFISKLPGTSWEEYGKRKNFGSNKIILYDLEQGASYGVKIALPDGTETEKSLTVTQKVPSSQVNE